MILPNALIDSNRKLKVSVKEFDELLAEVIEKFELPEDTFLSNVVADGDAPEPLSSLDDFSAKQKVQAWSPAQMAAAEAANDSPVGATGRSHRRSHSRSLTTVTTTFLPT